MSDDARTLSAVDSELRWTIHFAQGGPRDGETIQRKSLGRHNFLGYTVTRANPHLRTATVRYDPS